MPRRPPHGLDEDTDNIRIELIGRAALQFGKRIFRSPFLLVGALGRNRVVRVGNRNHPGPIRNALAFEPVGIA